MLRRAFLGLAGATGVFGKKAVVSTLEDLSLGEVKSTAETAVPKIYTGITDSFWGTPKTAAETKKTLRKKLRDLIAGKGEENHVQVEYLDVNIAALRSVSLGGKIRMQAVLERKAVRQIEIAYIMRQLKELK